MKQQTVSLPICGSILATETLLCKLLSSSSPSGPFLKSSAPTVSGVDYCPEGLPVMSSTTGLKKSMFYQSGIPDTDSGSAEEASVPQIFEHHAGGIGHASPAKGPTLPQRFTLGLDGNSVKAQAFCPTAQ